jgi:hypothetical protein
VVAGSACPILCDIGSRVKHLGSKRALPN